jgi:hypothetical protein
MATRVYKYGLLDPVGGVEYVQGQIDRAHRYRNSLVEIERDRRAALREVLPDDSALAAEVTRLSDEVEVLVSQIKAARAAKRSRLDVDSSIADARRRLAKLKADRTSARALLAARRKELRGDPVVTQARSEINDRSRAKVRDARKASGLRWGTYQLVEEAVGQAAKAGLYESEGVPHDPAFERWRDGRHDAQLSEQKFKGMSVSEIHAGDHTQVRIQPVSVEAWTGSRARRRRLSRTALHLRLYDDAGNRVWAEWPMLLHRPLPDDATIKRVTVSRRHTGRDVGRQWIWTCEITVSLPDAVAQWLAPSATSVVAGVDVGWRVTPRGVRVAVARYSDGVTDELLVDGVARRHLGKARELRGVRDGRLDQMRPRLAEWVRGQPGLPGWFKEVTGHMNLWKSPARFHRLAYRWRGDRFDGDVDGFDIIEKWRYRDEHLRDWERSERRKGLGRRKEQYRIWAARLAGRADVIVLEQFDLRKIARCPSVEDDGQNSHARRNRVDAAVSTLRQAVEHACAPRRTWCVSVPAQCTTMTCAACGSVESFDASAYITHACSACQATWDQDENAGNNLIGRYRERPGAALIVVGARVNDPADSESRWVRAKRLRAERDETARKEDLNTPELQP